MLPVGRIDDVERVMALLLPGAGLGPAAPASGEEAMPSLIERGLISKGGADGYVNAPRSAVWLRPFSWRRTGFALTADTVLLRRGVIARELALVPFARVQSVGIEQGPLQRRLGLGGVQLHTVAGPVSARLGTIDRRVAAELFETVAAGAVASGASDTSHHWGAAEAGS